MTATSGAAHSASDMLSSTVRRMRYLAERTDKCRLSPQDKDEGRVLFLAWIAEENRKLAESAALDAYALMEALTDVLLELDLNALGTDVFTIEQLVLDRALEARRVL